MRKPVFFCVLVILISSLTLTETLNADPISKPELEAVRLLLMSLGGGIGIKTLVASGAIVEVLVRLLKSRLSDRFFQKQKPWVRLALISTLTFAVTPLGLMGIGGVGLGAALVHAATLNAFLVFLDQILKHLPGSELDDAGNGSVRDSDIQDTQS